MASLTLGMEDFSGIFILWGVFTLFVWIFKCSLMQQSRYRQYAARRKILKLTAMSQLSSSVAPEPTAKAAAGGCMKTAEVAGAQTRIVSGAGGTAAEGIAAEGTSRKKWGLVREGTRAVLTLPQETEAGPAKTNALDALLGKVSNAEEGFPAGLNTDSQAAMLRYLVKEIKLLSALQPSLAGEQQVMMQELRELRAATEQSIVQSDSPVEPVTEQ